MFKIDQHIEHLLLDHNCVIVPGFGGFVVHDIPAHYDESDGMMLPPATTVGFNPQLIINDSLLIQSFVEAYDMSYPEAQREVEHETEEMKGLIADNNNFDIHSVGTISINSEGNYEFEPCQAGILVPRLYGLSGIDTNDNETFSVLKKQKVALVAQEKAESTEDEIEVEEQTEKVYTISASTLKKLAVACIAIFVLAAIPFVAQNDKAQHMISSMDFSFFTKFQPDNEVKKSEVTTKKITPVAPVEKKAEQKTTKPETAKVENKDNSEKEAVKENIAKQETAEQVKETPAGPTFTIVLAARVSKKNANNYVKRLSSTGYKDVRVFGKGKERKVVIGTYKTEAEANKYKTELSGSEEFAYAWVMKIN